MNTDVPVKLGNIPKAAWRYVPVELKTAEFDFNIIDYYFLEAV
jgi:hypothetical protein